MGYGVFFLYLAISYFFWVFFIVSEIYLKLKKPKNLIRIFIVFNLCIAIVYKYSVIEIYLNFFTIPLNILFVIILINENLFYKKLNDYSALDRFKNEFIMNLDKKTLEIKEACRREKKCVTRKLAEEFLNGSMKAIKYKASNSPNGMFNTVTHYPMLKAAIKIIEESNYVIGDFEFQLEEGLLEKDIKTIKKYYLYYVYILPLKILFWKEYLPIHKAIIRRLLKIPKIYKLKISFDENIIRIHT